MSLITAGRKSFGTLGEERENAGDRRSVQPGDLHPWNRLDLHLSDSGLFHKPPCGSVGGASAQPIE